MGHARALLPISPAMQIGLAQRVAAQGLSVRETERLANGILNSSKKNGPEKNEKLKPKTKHDPDLKRIENQMSDSIGLLVEIKTRTKGGEIKIKFSHTDELHNLLQKLGLTNL